MTRRWMSPRVILEQVKKSRISVLEVMSDMPSELPDFSDEPPPGLGGRRRARRGTVAEPLASRARSSATKRRAAVPEPGEFGEFEHEAPSLASRARPDLGTAAERRKSFVDAYNHPKARTDDVGHISGGANNTHKGKLNSGEEFVVKPLGYAGAGAGLAPGDEGQEGWMSDRWGSRHDASYAVAAAMGSHHMIAPGFTGKAHGDDRIAKHIARPDESSGPMAKASTVGSHMGKDSHVQQFIGDTAPLLFADDAAKEKVDGEHRLHGMVHHILFSNADGHGKNVLIHSSGHPVLIDHDLTLASGHQETKKVGYLKNIVSPFVPGGPLDYQSKMGKVGSKFPPRIQKTLEWLASGKHLKNSDWDLDPKDAVHLQSNAEDLLNHGLEGTLAKRNAHHRRAHTITPDEKTGVGAS